MIYLHNYNPIINCSINYPQFSFFFGGGGGKAKEDSLVFSVCLICYLLIEFDLHGVIWVMPQGWDLGMLGVSSLVLLSQSTAMMMLGWSVHLTTLFP